MKLKQPNKQTWGGTRPGAGRRKLGPGESRAKPWAQICIRVDPNVALEFRTLATSRDMTHAELLTSMVARELRDTTNKTANKPNY